MRPVSPDTLTRVSPSEAGKLSFEGSPSSVALHYASDGSDSESASGVPVKSAPDLVTATWDAGGFEAVAMIEVVASRYCSLGSILSYRQSTYQLNSLYDEDSDELWDARAKAEEVIERSCHRALQPVMRVGFVDRPNCTTRNMVLGPDGYDPDVVGVVSGGYSIKQARPGSPYVDVSGMPYGAATEIVYVSGLRTIPPEAGEAVRALAAWYLSPKVEPDNATTTTTEVGVLSYVIGGVDGAATSIPEVNALIERYGRKDLKVG